MTFRALTSALGLGAVVIALAIAAGASGSSARTSHDPCGSHAGGFVGHDGLHCGAIFHIPAHHTWTTPSHDAPPVCPHGQGIPGASALSITHAKWDYWTKQGKWVTWDGHFIDRTQHNPFAMTRIWPRFHNWASDPWAVRVYFYCENV